MEVPIEEIPQPARARIESLMRTVTLRCSLAKKVKTAEMVEKFFCMLPSYLREQVGADDDVKKQIGVDEKWVYDYLRRDGDWVDSLADSLYEEAVAVREDTVRAQLCSSIGKDVPEAYEISPAEEADARYFAFESAQSVADTYNKRLGGWIAEAKSEWWDEHGSYEGLDRFTLMKMVVPKIEYYDSWKVPEIAATTFSTEWQHQALSFWVLNRGSAELEYYLAPSSASDPRRDTIPICMEYAGRWLSEQEASMFPAHVNCIHYIARTRVKGGQLPLYFMIGGIRYNTEDLPDC